MVLPVGAPKYFKCASICFKLPKKPSFLKSCFNKTALINLMTISIQLDDVH